MDTFVCSSWYYLRYASPRYEGGPWRDDEIKYWLPMDQYLGGPEHACAHLIYFRFVTEFLYDYGYLPFDEPTANLLVQGIVFFGGHKMSKSKGNAVDPMPIIEKYGADSIRLFVLFAGPPEREIDWEDHIQREEGADFHDYKMVGVEGTYRFLSRVWRLVHENIDAIDASKLAVDIPMISDEELHRTVAFTIKSITQEIGVQKQLNTPVAALMELNNFLMKWIKAQIGDGPGQIGDGPDTRNLEARIQRQVNQARPQFGDITQALSILVRMLSPYAPHIAEELWERMGGKGSIFDIPWPGYDKKVVAESLVTCAVQVMGKLRDTIEVPPNISAEALEQLAKSSKAGKYIEGKQIVKVIAKPPRLINFVVK
jgi:leucyl-tRNA synthetase